MLDWQPPRPYPLYELRGSRSRPGGFANSDSVFFVTTTGETTSFTTTHYHHHSTQSTRYRLVGRPGVSADLTLDFSLTKNVMGNGHLFRHVFEPSYGRPKKSFFLTTRFKKMPDFLRIFLNRVVRKMSKIILDLSIFTK